jgi:hypothetical protein
MRIDEDSATTLQRWFGSMALDSVRIVESGPMCWFVRNVLKQGATTISPFIFYGRARFDPDRPSSLALLAHELKHVQQCREQGHVMFLARYMRDLAMNRFRYSRDLPLELEAYALQAEVLQALQG